MSDKNQMIDSQLLKRFDLNLLAVFELVYDFESVAEAADRMGRSSSAISQSLNKLRDFFSDPLFVRNGTKLIKTATAVNIHNVINDNYLGLLESIQELVSNNIRNEIRIHCAPYSAIRILPVLMNFIKNENIDCNVTHQPIDVSLTTLDDQLSLRQVDFIFDLNPIYRPDIINVPLTSDPIVWVCNENHPRIKDKLTSEMFQTEQFALYSSEGLVMRETRERIREMFGVRKQSFSSSSVFAIAAALEHSELVSLMPVWFFEKYGKSHSLKKVEAEQQIPDINIYMISRKNTLKNEIVKRISDGMFAEFEMMKLQN